MTTDTPDLIFDDATHTYSVGGKVYPSVTQIIRAAGMQPFLDQAHPIDLENGRERGTRVHQLVAAINLSGGRIPSSPKTREALEELEYFSELGYINGYLKWLEESRFQVDPKSVERQFINPTHVYAGTMDFNGVGGDSVPATVDVKSGGLEPAARLQLAAYQNCHYHRKGTPARRIVLQLTRDGDYRAHTLPISENAADWNAFLCCLGCYHFRARHFPKRTPPIQKEEPCLAISQ